MQSGCAVNVWLMCKTIRASLHTGNFSLEQVATYYACDKCTLQRNLHGRADTTYQALLDDVRRLAGVR